MGQKKSKAVRDARFKKSVRADPNQKVIDLLAGSANPLVSIGVVFLDLSRGAAHDRSMGFVVECLGDGYKLVVTCRHAFEHLGMLGSRLIVAFKTPKPTMLVCIGEPIMDTEPESDVAFLIVNDSTRSPTRPFDLRQEDPTIHPNQVLYNSRNQCDPMHNLYDVFVAHQNVTELDRVCFCKFTDMGTAWRIPASDIAERERLRAEGWIQCRLLRMVSRPGYSGSPIWDKMTLAWSVWMYAVQRPRTLWEKVTP